MDISLKIAEYLVDFILYKWTVTSGWGRVPWKIRYKIVLYDLGNVGLPILDNVFDDKIKKLTANRRN